jgi:hypothetical protein
MSSEWKYGRLERTEEELRAEQSAWWKAQPWWAKGLLYTVIGPAYAVSIVREFTHPGSEQDPVSLTCWGVIIAAILVLIFRDYRSRRRSDLPALR